MEVGHRTSSNPLGSRFDDVWIFLEATMDEPERVRLVLNAIKYAFSFKNNRNFD